MDHFPLPLSIEEELADLTNLINQYKAETTSDTPEDKRILAGLMMAEMEVNRLKREHERLKLIFSLRMRESLGEFEE